MRTAHQHLGEPPVIEEHSYIGRGGVDETHRITEMGEGESAESGYVYGGPAVISTDHEENAARPVEAQRPEKGDRDIDRVTYVVFNPCSCKVF